MRAEDVVELYSLLLEQGVQVWVDGGWGIDALLQEPTRPHKDFDALVQFGDLASMIDLLAGEGFALKEIWGENRFPVAGRKRRGRVATNSRWEAPARLRLVAAQSLRQGPR
jgi:lincosamide nucleotidyltransferase A/C/D/E